MPRTSLLPSFIAPHRPHYGYRRDEANGPSDAPCLWYQRKCEVLPRHYASPLAQVKLLSRQGMHRRVAGDANL